MNLESKVVFKCDIHNVFTFSHEFKNLDELRTIIQNQCVSETPYSIDIVRHVIVFNRDEKNNGVIYSPNGVNVADEKINLVVANKLIYPKDVRKILKKEYNSTFDMDTQKLDEKIPVKRFNVSEQNMTGMVVNGMETHYTLHDVYCEQLTPNDVVVDKNLNQIWPIKTGMAPYKLTEMLLRKKEIIR
jgi:hypothetical protein